VIGESAAIATQGRGSGLLDTVQQGAGKGALFSATPAKPGGRGKAAAGSEAASRTAEPYWGGEGEAGEPRSLLAERAIIAVHAFGRRGSIYSKAHAYCL
jgi:hypothetical protein